MTGIPDHICDVLNGAHDALIDCAMAAAHLLGEVRLGPDGEGQDFAEELEAIRDEARAAAAKIMALLSPTEPC